MRLQFTSEGYMWNFVMISLAGVMLLPAVKQALRTDGVKLSIRSTLVLESVHQIYIESVYYVYRGVLNCPLDLSWCFKVPIKSILFLSAQ